MDVLNSIVKKMLEQHKGGEVFFDHLDAAVRNKIVIDELIEILPSEANIIVSGKFGMFFHNYLENNCEIYNCKEIILVNGSLRKNTPIIELDYIKKKICNESYIFVDDSFYSGKTRNAVKAEIERLGGLLINTYVIYDGSKEKDPTVESLYRYYK